MTGPYREAADMPKTKKLVVETNSHIYVLEYEECVKVEHIRNGLEFEGTIYRTPDGRYFEDVYGNGVPSEVEGYLRLHSRLKTPEAAAFMGFIKETIIL